MVFGVFTERIRDVYGRALTQVAESSVENAKHRLVADILLRTARVNSCRRRTAVRSAAVYTAEKLSTQERHSSAHAYFYFTTRRAITTLLWNRNARRFCCLLFTCFRNVERAELGSKGAKSRRGAPDEEITTRADVSQIEQ